jgi:hypothetical protein
MELNALYGMPCCVWHLMSEMAFNAKNGIILWFGIEHVLISMQRGNKC